MHGRLKVKTTAQQAAERRADKNQKAQAYQTAMTAILDRRDAGCRDAVQLKMTAGILMSNPDVTVLWNIRKDVLQAHSACNRSEPSEKADLADLTTSTGLSQDETVSEFNAMLQKELDLTRQCLMTNPKSYGAWFHRTWCLARMQPPDWSQEVRLCDQFLALDDRNFHCWDYRRHAVKQAGVKPEAELACTQMLIDKNFSNYSAWHYRSKLLPILYPNPGQSGISINPERRALEIEMVRNAAFTDPEDSSAWFYHAWLIGPPSKISTAMAINRRKDGQIALIFSTPVVKSQFRVLLNGAAGSPDQVCGTRREVVSDSLWMISTEPSESPRVEVYMEHSDDPSLVLEAHQPRVEADIRASTTELHPDMIAALKEDRKFTEELIEIEPEAIWPRLAILKALSNFKFQKECLAESLKHLNFLIHADPQRKHYFLDLKSDIVLMQKLDEHCPKGCVDLSGLGLTRIAFPERLLFIDDLNLSNNHLKSLTFLPYLQNCSKLNLEDNQIDDIRQLSNPRQDMVVLLKGNKAADNPSKLEEIGQNNSNISFLT
ncbi:hypothetical protein TCAL_00783 [Tigriopus californicus]|uniref:Geranylgeranyl transferase type-2 subunit alpha n=1 Tax=Tigriopus californicus TaxID=6832 RepID=A0A553NF16_TIGCA|nr:geranylgeranyl transferase type-2 subunit alpha-like [Tigriopus californicus]TRY64005.1 hypothetical protein TCAL_00783 [Tigriopus californicus]|eukprot:TCALIF_00783-PA protein Name:"Similar to RABGGTA Geranylgeranyl transferase type-2 subunit alpha (Pongo abelii)" AED:0.00 eAED:0.00 QI:0/-1/0/1/-1/1/1/0/545